MPRRKTWDPNCADAETDSLAAAAELLLVGTLDPTDSVDQLLLLEAVRKDSYLADPDGAHVYLHRELNPADYVAEHEDCPHCGCVVVQDDSGRLAGYLPGRVQVHTRTDGQPRSTLDTCGYCHRSGLDSRIGVEVARVEARLDHLRSMKAADIAARAANFAQRRHRGDP